MYHQPQILSFVFLLFYIEVVCLSDEDKKTYCNQNGDFLQRGLRQKEKVKKQGFKGIRNLNKKKIFDLKTNFLGMFSRTVQSIKTFAAK